MNEIYKTLKQFGDVKLNAPLAKFTTFKIGGQADLLIEVSETDKLVGLLNWLSGEGVDYFILGGGSNILFPDEGYRGVVIKIRNQKFEIRNQNIKVDAGVLLAVVLSLAVKNSLSGLEWATGLPGTVGGAIRGNASSRWGAVAAGETADKIESVTIWRNREVLTLPKAECGFGYRSSDFKHNSDVVLSAIFKLEPSDPQKILATIQEVAKLRAKDTPPHPSAGCFFKNIKDKEKIKNTPNLPEIFITRGAIPAAWLIDQCGLKDFKLGGAKISSEHCNYIVNFNNATQTDVLALVEKVKSEVYNKFGVELEEEVQVVK